MLDYKSRCIFDEESGGIRDTGRPSKRLLSYDTTCYNTETKSGFAASGMAFGYEQSMKA